MKIVIFLTSILFSSSSYAQIKDKHLSTIIKVPASMLMGEIYSQSIGFGVEIEKQKTQNKSVSLGIGYFFKHPTSKPSFLREQVDQINGFRMNAEIRKYLGKKSITKSGFFVSVDWDHILSFTKENVWLNGNKMNEKITRYRTTSHLNIGVQSFAKSIKEQNRISLELLVGFGLGYVNARSNLEDQIFIQGITKNINYNNGVGVYPAFNFDIKLGFAF